MNNFDFCLMGALSTGGEQVCLQLDELKTALDWLDHEHPGMLIGDKVEVSTDTLRNILSAFRKLKE